MAANGFLTSMKALGVEPLKRWKEMKPLEDALDGHGILQLGEGGGGLSEVDVGLLQIRRRAKRSCRLLGEAEDRRGRQRGSSVRPRDFPGCFGQVGAK